MLERKRAAKTYQGVPGDEETGGAGMGDEIELTEGMEPQESGVTTSGQREGNMDTELDNWDENAEDDWDQDEANMANGGYQKPKTPPPGEADRKKRDD
ncbi:MAG: hypothetical protein M1831_005236 [Alyxoria varia]|nr:MAG: hypothetical protein M1831_005236 [Alyxoria varia]